MKTFDSKNRSLTGLAALLLLGLFALCTLGVLLQGASVYRRVAAAGSEAYEARTCAQFFATKVRQAPSAAAVSLSDFAGGALVITEALEGQKLTVILPEDTLQLHLRGQEVPHAF